MRKIILFVFFILFSFSLYSQKIGISGRVLDKKTSDPLIGATVTELNSGEATFTNDYGQFYLRVPVLDTIVLRITYVGYDTVYREITGNNRFNNLQIYLSPGVKIEAVSVIGTARNNDFSYSITQKEIKLLPSLTGDFDVLKSFQLLPGIQFGIEGTTGLYVLGGTPDQNLILLDGLPLFYVKHLTGFVSILDIEAIRKARLIRSGFDAKYGGRLSSYVDVLLKDGDPQNHHSTLNIGLLSSKFSSNGYIVKDKLTYLLSLRYSTFSFINYLVQKLDVSNNDVFYDFYDMTFKLNYKLDQFNSLQWIFYNGKDNFTYQIKDNRYFTDYDYSFFEGEKDPFYSSIKLKNNWGNFATGGKWIYNKNNLLTITTVGYTRYGYEYKGQEWEFEDIENKEDSLLGQYEGKRFSYVSMPFGNFDLTFQISHNFQINSGLFFNYYSSLPFAGYLKQWEDSLYRMVNFGDSTYNMILQGGYFSFGYSSGRFDFFGGLRTTLWQGTFYNSPRLRLKVKLSNKLDMSVAYSHVYQFIHLLANGTSNMVPQDMWLVSRSDMVMPETSNLWDVKFIWNTRKLRFSLGVFNKNFSNLIDYNRVSFGTERTIWDRVEVNGKGWAYGAYSMLEYNSRKLNFWLSYTYLQNYRQFANLNSGRPFPNYYHRKHNLNLVMTWRPNKHWSFSGVFIYGSGMPYTLSNQSLNYIQAVYGDDFINIDNSHDPYIRYRFDEELPYYTGINNYRLPDYHRLDLAVRYNGVLRRFNKAYTLSFNVINVYARMNPLLVLIDYDGFTHELKLEKFSLLPVVPSLSFEINL